MQLHKISVRTKNPRNFTPCAAQLTEMLACWATTGDKQNVAACANLAITLHACMRSTPPPRKSHKSTINYHLARLHNQINK